MIRFYACTLLSRIYINIILLKAHIKMHSCRLPSRYHNTSDSRVEWSSFLDDISWSVGITLLAKYICIHKLSLNTIFPLHSPVVLHNGPILVIH